MDRAPRREPGRRLVETFEGVLRNPQLLNDAELDSVVPEWNNTSHRGSGVAREGNAPALSRETQRQLRYARGHVNTTRKRLAGN